MAIAIDLEQRVRAKSIPHVDSDVTGVVTISLGVAGWEVGTPADAASLLAESDRQLYRAKNAGRGQACGAVMKSI
jgi:PleD family two-component response regulator